MKNYVKEHKISLMILAIALVVILLTSFIGCLVQTSGFSVKVTELYDVTAEETVATVDLSAIGGSDSAKVTGFVESGLLFVPNDASADNQLPGVVLTHGYLNSYELQLSFGIELARRGYVVLIIDRENHGSNQVTSSSEYSSTYGSGAYGASMYNAAAYLYATGYVDVDNIAISGHSMGGLATNMGLWIDTTVRNAGGVGIISAGLVQANNAATYAYHSEHTVGILKATDDEFFFKSTLADGTSSISRQYLQSTAAAAFIGITEYEATADGIDIQEGVKYVGGVAVTGDTDEPFRVIYEAEEIHPLNHWSVESTSNLVSFMYDALGTPSGYSEISTTNQVWWLKEVASAFGFVALFALIFPVADLLLTVPCFAGLRKKKVYGEDGEEIVEVTPALKGVRKHVSYWVAGVVTTLFSGLIAEPLFSGKEGWDWTSLYKMFFAQNTYYPQDTTGKVATWAIVCGLFALLAVTIIYFVNRIIDGCNKSEGAVVTASPFAAAKISMGDFVKTVLLGGVIAFLFYVVVFINWSIFTVDFRVWTFAIGVFDVTYMLPTMLRYSVAFFIFYAINSMFNQGYRTSNLPEWATIAINAFFNVAGLLLVFAIQYGTFTSTGVLWQAGMSLSYIVLFPIVPTLIAATVISRRLYVKTGNSWLGAVVNTLIFTIMTVASTSASYAYVGFFS